MKPITISLSIEETQVIDDLTIKNLGAGHKILMAGGDLSFIELQFSVPGEEVLQVRFFDHESSIIFDRYRVAVQKISWNSEPTEVIISSK